MGSQADLEVDRALALERLRADIKSSSHKRRDLVKYHLNNGVTNLEYLAARYGLRADDVERARQIWGIELKPVSRDSYKLHRSSNVSTAESPAPPESMSTPST